MASGQKPFTAHEPDHCETCREVEGIANWVQSRGLSRDVRDALDRRLSLLWEPVAFQLPHDKVLRG